MGSEPDHIAYYLPLSSVRFTGTVTCRRDEALETDEKCVAATCSADVFVAADHATELKLKIEHGFFRDTNFSFERSEDGRLSSTSAELTGEAGKFVTGVLGVAVTAAGAAIGGLPGAAVGGALAAGAVKAQRREVTQSDDTKLTPQQRVEHKYGTTYPEMADLRKQYAALATTLPKRIADLTAQLAENPEERLATLGQLRAVQQALNLARAELDILNHHFATWRSSTIKSRTKSFEFAVSLDELTEAGTTIKEGAPDLLKECSGQTAAKVKDIWETLGAFVTVEDIDARVAQPDNNAGATKTDETEVLMREPRNVRISLYKKDDSDRAELVQSKTYLVVDAGCRERAIRLPKKRLFGKRTSALKFSPGGALTSFSSGETSAGASIGELAGSLPSTVASGLEQSTKLWDSVSSLRSKALDERLATLKKQVELKQNEITAAGLEATESDAAELERLKQQAAILDNQKAIGESSLALSPSGQDLARLQQEIELLKAQRETSVSERHLTAESELADLRLEIERLKTENRALAEQKTRPDTNAKEEAES